SSSTTDGTWCLSHASASAPLETQATVTPAPDKVWPRTRWLTGSSSTISTDPSEITIVEWYAWTPPPRKLEVTGPAGGQSDERFAKQSVRREKSDHREHRAVSRREGFPMNRGPHPDGGPDSSGSPRWQTDRCSSSSSSSSGQRAARSGAAERL